MAKTVTLGAVGDIDFSGATGENIRKRGFAWPFRKMLPHLRKADLLFGNMESVTLPPGYPADAVDPAGLVGAFNATPALLEAGFDFMCLANNHVLDGGHAGMFHTRQAIESLGIATGGVGATQEEARRMRVIEKHGIRFGFLCYCEDTNYSLGTRGPCHAYFTLPNILEDIAGNRRNVDILVVSIHADLEFMETPSLPRREISRLIARAGASIILEHHPHVPQGVERVGGCLIAYSLGNFYFRAQSMAYMREHSPHTGHSFLLLAEVSKKGVQAFDRVPFVIPKPPEERPTPLAGKARREMLAYLEDLDNKVRNDDLVRRNWRDIAMRHLHVYLDRVLRGEYTKERLIDDVLGRLLLVRENRQWVDEAFAVIREDWERRQSELDPHHRPYYRYTRPPGTGR